MNNYLIALIILMGSVTFVYSQPDSLKPEDLQLTKGKWKFHVNDTLLEPFVNGDFLGTYHFKRSGKLIKTDVSFIINNVTYRTHKGKWELNGNVLTIKMDDIECVKYYPKSITITVLKANVFYSPQQDYKTFYWVFERKN